MVIICAKSFENPTKRDEVTDRTQTKLFPSINCVNQQTSSVQCDIDLQASSCKFIYRNQAVHIIGQCRTINQSQLFQEFVSIVDPFAMNVTKTYM